MPVQPHRLEDLERLGILVENEQVDLAVGRIAKRTATPPVIAQCIGNLGEGGLMRIAKELYALSPAALTLYSPARPAARKAYFK